MLFDHEPVLWVIVSLMDTQRFGPICGNLSTHEGMFEK
ncbi:hypothetical protein Z947_4135 [Sulfitobacter geojensis]|nr:hypothetical protein Z947_4135 [Sulfitobacter geojensis]